MILVLNSSLRKIIQAHTKNLPWLVCTQQCELNLGLPHLRTDILLWLSYDQQTTPSMWVLHILCQVGYLNWRKVLKMKIPFTTNLNLCSQRRFHKTPIQLQETKSTSYFITFLSSAQISTNANRNLFWPTNILLRKR